MASWTHSILPALFFYQSCALAYISSQFVILLSYTMNQMNSSSPLPIQPTQSTTSSSPFPHNTQRDRAAQWERDFNALTPEQQTNEQTTSEAKRRWMASYYKSVSSCQPGAPRDYDICNRPPRKSNDGISSLQNLPPNVESTISMYMRLDRVELGSDEARRKATIQHC
ncbi:hypothetical protein BDP27DRAFT_1368045 [Rhodocollybia butyracea]|uniref:Uncharacterized protein n=1 Tax=Rhodocollybia butyracea TaxID=206335 RepID=A0A9P5PHC3_9AGAR|nr:hypothetical protein BDP27DRAFT_1368045 [Rhodocollybia butyracea]